MTLNESLKYIISYDFRGRAGDILNEKILHFDLFYRNRYLILCNS